MADITRFGVSIEDNLLQTFDSLIKDKGYSNRSEAIRDLIRDKIVQAVWADENKEVIGTITLIYNHHFSDVSDNLVHIQHDHHKSVISTTHVHLDEHNCLEVLIVNGKSKDIRQIADKLIGAKGVKHGKLTMSAKGEEL